MLRNLFSLPRRLTSRPRRRQATRRRALADRLPWIEPLEGRLLLAADVWTGTDAQVAPVGMKTTIGATRTTGQTVSRDQMTRWSFPRPLPFGGPPSIRPSRSAPWSSTALGAARSMSGPLTVLSTSSMDSGRINLINAPLTVNSASTSDTRAVAARSPATDSSSR